MALAGAAAATLNFALLSTFVWSELVAPGVRIAVWVAVLGVWMGSALFSLLYGERLSAVGSPNEDYAEALDYYLKGDWFQAERLLLDLLRGNPRDLEARLMLATLFRHTSRFDEAGRQMDILSRAEGCQKWEVEIGRERDLLAEKNREDAEIEEEETETADLLENRPEQKNAA